MKIEVKLGDITLEETDAIVNAANSSLSGGGGVDGAIHRAAGYKELQNALRKIGHCPTGQACLTPGFNLKAKWIIHTVGPIYKDGYHNESKLLESCYKNCLKIADEINIKSIAFPAISCGVYGYPISQACKIAANTVKNTESNLELVRFVLFDDQSYEIYLEELGISR